MFGRRVKVLRVESTTSVFFVTPYRTKHFGYDVTCIGGAGVDRLTQSLFNASNASVDLNPHQVEAALLPIRSPLSKGAFLADEVGLGKTIEASLVLWQYWAERKKESAGCLPCVASKTGGLEQKKRSARRKIFETEDEIGKKRDFLIEALQKKLVQDVKTQTRFTLRWEVV